MLMKNIRLWQSCMAYFKHFPRRQIKWVFITDYRFSQLMYWCTDINSIDELLMRIVHLQEILEKEKKKKATDKAGKRESHFLALYMSFFLYSLTNSQSILTIRFHVSCSEEHTHFLAVSSKHPVSIGKQRAIKGIWSFISGFDLMIPYCSINRCVK